MKRLKLFIPLLVIAAALLAIFLGGSAHFGPIKSESTAQALEGPWSYTTDSGAQGTVMVPGSLQLSLNTGRVSLTAALPNWQGEGYALRIKSMQQSVEVLVDGETRYTYGAEVDDPLFVYHSAAQGNLVPLLASDSGKELTIIYRAPPLFRIELGLLREVLFGLESDLVRYDFVTGMPITLVSLFSLFITLCAVLIALTSRDSRIKGYLCLLVLAVIALIFYNTENYAMWPMLRYATTLSAWVDWVFYILDSLIPQVAWLSMYLCGWNFRGWRRYVAPSYGCVYIAALLLSQLGLFPFNVTRPFFMAAGFAFTLILFFDHRKHRGADEQNTLSWAALVVLAGYYLDYIKYCLMLLPLSAKWSVYLQLKLPFQFFIGIGLLAFSFIVLRSTMERLARRRAEAREAAAIAQLQAQYAMHQYEALCHSDLSIRTLRHDTQYHFRVVSSLLEEGQSEEAKRYLAGLSSTVSGLRLSPWCEDSVADITIGWYAEQFRNMDIPFAVEANIPSLREDCHADLCCLLSNALQNALEGSKGVENPAAELQAYPKGNALLVKVENRCDPALGANPRGFITTKSGEGHGLGLTSMRAAAERRGGYLRVEASDGLFRLDAVLCSVFPERASD